MKKGLASFGQVSYSKVIWPLQTVTGGELGPTISQVVDVADETPVGSDFFWVDVPDDTIPWDAYYDTATSTTFDIGTTTYYATSDIPGFAEFTQPVEVQPASDPAPVGTTALVPPSVSDGQTLYWYDNAWVVSSFDPSLSLPEAKSLLIQTTTLDGAAAVNAEVALYSTVQQIEAPSVSSLDTKTYPGVTIGEYQTYVDSLVASATSTINAATTTEDLYTFNPAEIPFTPADPATASGVISIGRSGSGGFDLNNSYYVSFSSLSVDPSDTYLQAVNSLNSVSYDGGLTPPTTFAATAGFFDPVIPEDWRVRIRRTSDDSIIATVDVTTSGSNVELSF